MSRLNHQYWEFKIFFATKASSNDMEEPLGILVSVKFGDTTIYLIGVTNNKGKKFQANYVLLWEAILEAQRNGCKWFDIGGLNKTTPKGISHFKKVYSLIYTI